jgi:peptidoglycan/LPS O-acetylase OafA/YrhL
LLKESWPLLGFRKDIQGLRAVAVLLVIIFHADIPTVHGGYIGVDVFFVISGYLITSLLFNEIVINGSINFKQFYARRIRRILPLSVCVTLITLIVFAFFISPWELKELSKTSLLTSFFSSNIWFIVQVTDYFGAETESNPLLHTWSLAVEEQFYFLWPALLALLPLISKTKRVWMWSLISVLIVSLGAFLFLYYHNQPLAFFSMPTRAWQFSAGALICFAPSLKDKSISFLNLISGTGLLFILTTALTIGAGFDGNPLWALVPTFGAALIIWAGLHHQTFAIARILSTPLLVFIGRLSFSLYLWHWPVIVFFKLNSINLEPEDIVLALLVTFLLSWWSYRFIESPFRKHKLLNTTKRSLLFGCCLILVGLCSSLSYYYYAKFSLMSPAQSRIESTQFASKAVESCVTSITDTQLVECELGEVQSNKVVTVLGDSKAQQWLPVLDELGVKHGWKIIVLVKSGCSPAFINPYLVYLGREYHECNTWRKSALDKLLEVQPELVVVSHYSGYSISELGTKRDATKADYLTGYELLNQQLLSLDTKLLFIRDNPQFPISIPKCLSRAVGAEGLIDELCVFSEVDVEFRKFVFDAAKSVFDTKAAAQFLDLTPFYCEQRRCPSFKHNIVRYTDRHHLSYDFTKQLSPIIEDRLISLMQTKNSSASE